MCTLSVVYLCELVIFWFGERRESAHTSERKVWGFFRCDSVAGRGRILYTRNAPTVLCGKDVCVVCCCQPCVSAAGSKSCDISRFRGTKTQKQQQKSVRFDVEQLQSIAICRFYLRVCGCDKTAKIDAATAEFGAKFW